MAWQLHTKPYDDLPTFYWATRLAFEQGLSAYQPSHFLELGQALDRKIYPFLYPPPSVLLFSPVLLCVDYEQCKVVYSALNLLCWWSLVWILYIFYARCLAAVIPSFWVGVLMAWVSLVYLPLIDTLKNGQVNLLVLLCLMPLLLAPVGRGQQVLCGVLLACAITLKIYVLLLLPVMLIFGRWRETLTTLVCLALLVVISVGFLPESMWHEWFVLGSHAGYGRGIPHLLTIPFNQSVNGFFIRHFLDQRGAGQPTDWIWPIYAVAMIGVSVVLYVVFKYLRHWQQGYSAALALVLLLMNLIAPLTWLHHYVFALPALVWTLVLLQRLPQTGQKHWVVMSFVLAVALWSVPFVIARGWLAGLLPGAEPGQGMHFAYNLMLSSPLVAATAIFVILVYLVTQRH